MYKLIGKKFSKTRVQCTAWGLRKLLTLFIKRIGTTSRPRDAKVRQLKRVLLESWYPSRLSELDDPNNEPWLSVNFSPISRALIRKFTSSTDLHPVLGGSWMQVCIAPLIYIDYVCVYDYSYDP